MREKYRWAARGYIILGIIAVPLYLFGNGVVQTGLSTLVGGLVLVAPFVAWRVYRLSTRFFAILLTIGALYVIAEVTAIQMQPRAAAMADTGIDIVASILLIAVFAFAVRSRRGPFTSGDILDGIIIGVGAWLVSWICFVQPYLASTAHPPLGLVANALYLPMAAPLLALAAMIAFSSSLQRPAPLLLVAGLLANLIGDAFYAMHELNYAATSMRVLADALYLPAFAFSAAALVHPSAPDILEPAPVYRRLQLSGRITLTGLALILPTLLIALVPAASLQDHIIRAVSAVTGLVLVSIRLAGATKSHLEAQDELIASSRKDALTNLPNRIALLEQTQQLLDTGRRDGPRPSVYLIDIDRFKNTNDTFGYASGDEALRLIAKRLTTLAAEFGATIGRPSGDEFLVVDPHTRNQGDALAHAEALKEVFCTPIPLQAGPMFLTASIGVATTPAQCVISASDLLRHADIAMYRAKDAGRNCLALYHESMQERLAHRMAIETAMHSAVEEREFLLHHQPIVNSETGQVNGFEALIRWQQADGTMLSPAEFIPIAEENGLITSIGSWALLEALSQLRYWIDDGVVSPATTMSVNVSARQLADPGFCDVVSEALARSNVAPGLLWLEVTETMMIDNPDLARDTLVNLRNRGVRVALDDFGTGYSSLSLLQQFPIQRVKIDRSFVNGIADCADDRSLVRTIIAMGNSMHLDVVGEGVETVEQLKMLRRLGCDKAQGYLISRPVAADAMRSTIAALNCLAESEVFSDILTESSALPRSRRQLGSGASRPAISE